MPQPTVATPSALTGIGLFCSALVCFACLDSAAKFAAQSVPAIQVAWIRFLVHGLIVLVVLRPWRNWARYRSDRPIQQVVRAVFLFMATVCNFQALRTLQLDQTTAISFGSAFTIAALAGPVLGERVGLRRWTAIAIGFIGVLIVIRPGTSAFQPAMFYSVGSVAAYTGYILMTRILAVTESAAGMLLVLGVVPAILLAPIALPTAVWPPSIFVAAALVATGIFGATGHWLLTHAHRLAPASTLTPYFYTQMIWMVAAGYVFFGDVPDRMTLAGSGVIIASGLYVFYREQLRRGG